MTPDVIGTLIPIVAIVFGIGIAIVKVLANHRQRMQRTELRHRERLAAIDKGLELPPDPPDFEPRRTDNGRFLRQGLVLVLVGAALTAGLMQLPSPNIPYLFGLVPAAIGLAYLLYYFLHERARARGGEARPPAPGAGGPG